MLTHRAPPDYKVGDFVKEVYNDEQGTIQEVDWSVGFGTWAYKILRATDSRYGGKAGTEVWVYQGFYLRKL